jgi:hypothetical protein
MNLNNKIAFAVTLAVASLNAHAQEKGMDIGFRPTKAAPTTVTPANPAPVVVGAAAVARQVAAPATPAQQAAKQVAPSVETTQATPQAKPVAAATPKRVVAVASVAPAAEMPPSQAAPPSRPSQAQPATAEGDINPFTGRDLSAEQRQRQLESAKMDTDLIQEKLKQANLIAELTYLPLKKRAEVAALPGMATASNQANVPVAKAAFEDGAAAATRPVRKAVKKTATPKKVEPVAAPVAAVPAAPSISVSGISINGTKASAIVEADGGVMSVQHGESTPFGQLRVVDSRTITLGGRTYHVRDAMLSRMTVSDPVYVDPEKARINAPIPTQPAAVPLLNLPPLPPLPQPPKGMTASMAPTPTR